MYQHLAAIYESIFPLSPLALDFIREYLPDQNEHSAVLDVGCATGALCRALTGLGYPAVGIDPDREMIKQAEKLAKGTIPFYSVGMQDIGNRFPENSFEAVLCLGNTLAHLTDLNEIETFFADVSRILVTGGSFVFQTVNFDRILQKGMPEFPVIERKNIRFTRHYEQMENDKGIRFTTILETGSERKKQIGSCRLFPVTKKELKATLIKTGFSEQKWFGSYRGERFSQEESPATICQTKIGEPVTTRHHK